MGTAIAVSDVLLALTVGGGLAPGSGATPGNVSSIVVNYAYLDPVALMITLSVSFTPPAGGTFVGCHLWLEIPDQSSGTTTPAVVGSTPVGTSTIAAPWAPIDLGLQSATTSQPWTIQVAFPTKLGLNPAQNIACRLYLASYSNVVDNTLIRNGLSGATPNVAFTLVSEASGSPSAGSNLGPNCGTVLCTVDASQNVSGKLVTPILALMGSVPSNPPSGWGYRLYISYGNADPTNPANLTPVTGVETVAGVVPPPSSSESVTGLYSFVIATPKVVTQATIWALAGISKNGSFTPNTLVPGITNACPITLGTTTGTIDASQVIETSIADYLTTELGVLGITAGGLTGELIAAETITGTLLALTGIITNSAQIGNLLVGDAQIGSCSVSKLLAGTATFTGTAIFENASGPQVAIESTGLTLTGGAYSISITTSSGISISESGGPSLALTSSGLTLSNGSYEAVVSASNIQLTNGSGTLELSSSGITLYGDSSYGISIDTSGNVTFQGLTTASKIEGGIANFSGAVTVGTLGGTNLQLLAGTTTSASAGSESLPSAPAGFLTFYVDVNSGGTGGTEIKVPYYNA
jgi:hypothetical protein